jgi:YD repeat-containing protein
VRPISALTDRNGHRVSYLYADSGLPAEVRHSGGYRIAVDVVHTGFGPRVEALRLLDGTGGGLGTTVLAYGYDARGRLAEITNSSGLPIVYRHDAQDRITSWTDRNGHWYAYEYGSDGRVTRGHGTDGVLDATFDHDPRNRVTTVTDSLGCPTSYHGRADDRQCRQHQHQRHHLGLGPGNPSCRHPVAPEVERVRRAG